AIAVPPGLPGGRRGHRGALPEKTGRGARDALDGLAGQGIRQEADEIARIPRLQRNTDFAVRLETANPRSMSGARVDDDERSPRRIEFDPGWRNDPHQAVVHRPVQ